MNSVHEPGSRTMSKNRLKNNTESNQTENRPSAPSAQPVASPRAPRLLPRPARHPAPACPRHVAPHARPRLPAAGPALSARALLPAEPACAQRAVSWPCSVLYRNTASASSLLTIQVGQLYCNTLQPPANQYCNTISSLASHLILQYNLVLQYNPQPSLLLLQYNLGSSPTQFFCTNFFFRFSL